MELRGFEPAFPALGGPTGKALTWYRHFTLGIRQRERELKKREGVARLSTEKTAKRSGLSIHNKAAASTVCLDRPSSIE